jgi:hypothetical protein
MTRNNHPRSHKYIPSGPSKPRLHTDFNLHLKNKILLDVSIKKGKLYAVIKTVPKKSIDMEATNIK